MRFEYYKILSTTSHVGAIMKKNYLLKGSITHQTYSGYTERGAFYYKIEWEPFFYGNYILALVFLYGGHLHIINTKKEWAGLFKRFFQTLQKKDGCIIRKEKNPFLLEYLHFDEESPDESQNEESSDEFQEIARLYSHLKEKRKRKKKSPSYLVRRLFSMQRLKQKKKKVQSIQKKSGTFPIKKKKGSAQSFRNLRKNISFQGKKPILTIQDSGERGSLSNWTEHVRFSNQFLSVPEQYRKFFSQYKKLFEDFRNLENQCIGVFPSTLAYSLQRKKPDIILVLNAGKEYGILFESFRQSLPVFGAVNTFTKKEWIDFPWNGNDTSLYSMALWCRWILRIFQYVQQRRFQRKFYYFTQKENLEEKRDLSSIFL